MRHLYVFYENKKIGVLTLSDDDIYSFEYDARWQDDPESFAISLAMPLEQQSFARTRHTKRAPSCKNRPENLQTYG